MYDYLMPEVIDRIKEFNGNNTNKNENEIKFVIPQPALT